MYRHSCVPVRHMFVLTNTYVFNMFKPDTNLKCEKKNNSPTNWYHFDLILIAAVIRLCVCVCVCALYHGCKSNHITITAT